jgi:hypothetical protein
MKVALQLGMRRELPSLPMFRPSASSNSSMCTTKRTWWQRQQVDAAAHARAPRQFPARDPVRAGALHEACNGCEENAAIAGTIPSRVVCVMPVPQCFTHGRR